MYQTILIDPPWPEYGGGRIKRGADRHYPLMEPEEILGAIYDSGVFHPAEKCHLYLWVTNNYIPDGLLLTKMLGFKYITFITWVKDKMGLGQYFRGQTEHIIFSVRGKQPTLVNNQPTFFYAKRRLHSEKPEKARRIIEKCSLPPRLEMFSRYNIEGWETWGNEKDAIVRPACKKAIEPFF